MKDGEVGMTNQEAIRILNEQRNKFMDEWVDFGCVNEAYNMAISLLEKVVRCKNCKWFIKKFENEGRCIKHDNDYHDPDWFCADGERKDT